MNPREHEAAHRRPVPTVLPMLHDIDMTGLADGDTLVWDSTAKLWKPGAGGGSSTPRCSAGFYASDGTYTHETASGSYYPDWTVDVTDGTDHPTIATGTISGQTYYAFTVHADGLYVVHMDVGVETTCSTTFPRELNWSIGVLTSNGGPDTYVDANTTGKQQVNHSPTYYVGDLTTAPIFMKSGGSFLAGFTSDWPKYGSSAAVTSILTNFGAYVARVA